MKKIIIIFLITIGFGFSLLIGIWFSVDLNTVMQEMLSRLSKRINGEILLGGIEAGAPGKVILRGIKIRKDQKEVIDIPELHVHLSLADLFRFKTTLKSLVFQSPKILLEQQNNRWNLEDIQKVEPVEEDETSLKNIVPTQERSTSISGLKVDELKVQGAHIIVSKNGKELKFRAGLKGQMANGNLHLDSWIIAMENESVIRGIGKAQFHPKAGSFSEIDGTIEALDMHLLLDFFEFDGKLAFADRSTLSGTVNFRDGRLKPNLELKIAPFDVPGLKENLKASESGWKLFGDLIEGHARIQTPLGTIDSTTKINWVNQVIRSDIRSKIETTINGHFLSTKLNSSISAKKASSQKLEVNGVASFLDWTIDKKSQDQAELLFKVEYNPDKKDLDVLRAVLDFPKTSGRIEANGRIPLIDSEANKPEIKLNIRDLRLDKLVPIDRTLPLINLTRLIATIENNNILIESGTGTLGKGRFHIKGKIPSINHTGSVEGLRVHLEKIPLKVLDPRLAKVTLDFLDLTPDSKLNASISDTSGTKIAVGGVLNQSTSPIRDLLIMGEIHPFTLHSFLPQLITTTSSQPLKISMSGSSISSIESSLVGTNVFLTPLDDVNSFELSDFKQKLRWNGDQEILTFLEGKASLLGGNMRWSGDVKLFQPYWNSLSLEVSSMPLNRILGHFTATLGNHFVGDFEAAVKEIKISPNSSDLPVACKISGSIKSPEYLYHQTILDLLNSVKLGIGKELVQGLIAKEIDEKATEQNGGVILKDLVNLKAHLSGNTLIIEPFTIEEYRNEFELQFDQLTLKIPSQKADVASINGTVAMSLSADFLKKNLPLKSDFNHSFKKQLIFNGPLTMPFDEVSLNSIKADLIALITTQMDVKALEIDLKSKVKSIQKEAKEVLKEFINGDPDTKLQNLKETREAFKGLLKGLMKKDPKNP